MPAAPDPALVAGCNRTGLLGAGVLSDWLEEQGYWWAAVELRSGQPADTAILPDGDGDGDGYGYGDGDGDGYGNGYGDGYGYGYGYGENSSQW